MSRFSVFDVETANAMSHSICSIGIVVVENQRIIDEYYTLVQPLTYFSSFNISIHGITPQDVADAPTFADIWCDIKPYFENQIVLAHNASFDVCCLRSVLDIQHIPWPAMHYACTYLMGKRIVPSLPNYKLPTVAAYVGYHFAHHHALADAQACAHIALHYLDKNPDCPDLDALHKKYHMAYGRLEEHTWIGMNKRAPRCKQ